MAQVTVLSQVLRLLPRDSFNRVVKKHQSNKHSKGISTWDHLVSMLFSHIADARSLRDISNGLRSTLGNRSHLGLSRVPGKSSLSYLNEHRDWRVFKDFYFELYDHLRAEGLPRRNDLKNIRRKILLMDASVVPLCLSLYDWAAYRSKKGGIKLHAVPNYDGLLLVFCDLTDAKTHEVTVAGEQVYPKGSVVVFDRGYTDFGWWVVLDSTGVFFITRAKNNPDYRILKEHDIPYKNRKEVLGDYTVELRSTRAKEAGLKEVRLIRYYDKEQDRTFEFITNQRSWTAADVALAYKERRHIEVFFKFIKQNVHIKSFVGTSPNAVLTRIRTGLIAFLLLRYLQHKAAFKWALSNPVSFIRLACFTKVSLMQWLDHPFEIEKPPPKDGALALF